MAAKGGSKKGTPFERLVCVELSKWWTNGKRDDVFSRTAGSGGRATRRGRKGQTTVNHCGDIQASDPDGFPLMKLCAIECKRGLSGFTLQDILDAPKGKPTKPPVKQLYEQWFDQAAESAKHAGSIGWLIIVRRDKRQALAMLGGGLRGHLGIPMAEFSMRLTLEPSGVVCVRLEAFLAALTPDHVRKLTLSPR